MWRQNKKWAADCLSRFSKTREIRKTAPSWPVDGWALCFTRFRQFPTFSTRFTVHTSTHVQMFHSDGSQIENRRRIIGKKRKQSRTVCWHLAHIWRTSSPFRRKVDVFWWKWLTKRSGNTQTGVNNLTSLLVICYKWETHEFRRFECEFLSSRTALPRNCNSSFSLVSSNKLKNIYFNYLNV